MFRHSNVQLEFHQLVILYASLVILLMLTFNQFWRYIISPQFPLQGNIIFAHKYKTITKTTIQNRNIWHASAEISIRVDSNKVDIFGIISCLSYLGKDVELST